MKCSTDQAKNAFNLAMAAVCAAIFVALLSYSLTRLAPAVLAFNETNLNCDTPVTDTINPANDSDFFSFTATDGERVEINVVKTSPSGANFQPFWRLVRNDGNPAGVCGSFVLSTQGECGPLSSAFSPYRIEVRDFNSNDTGTYRVHFYRLPAATACENTALACSVPAAATIDNPSDSDFFSFNVVPNEFARITVVTGAQTGTNFQPAWRLVANNGNPASSCGFFVSSAQVICGPLSADGNPYRVEVQDFNRDDVGQYSVTVNFTVAACPSATISLAPNPLNIVAGLSGNLTVTLNQARNAPTTMALTSANPAVVSVPNAMTVPANATSASFPVTGVAVGGPVAVTATLPLTLGGGSATAALNVTAPAISLSSCSQSPTPGTGCTMTATITPALDINTTLALSSSNTSIATVPSSLTIPAGSQPGSFQVTGVAVGGPVTIAARLPTALGGGQATASVTVGSVTTTAQIEIIPPNPTADDNISVRISGTWPNSCAPQNPQVSMIGNEISIATSNPGGACLTVLTNWGHTVGLGQLATGDYTVTVTYTAPNVSLQLGRRNFTVLSPPIVSRIVRVADTNANPNSQVSVPITLNSQGNENAIGLSLSFNTAILSNPQVTLGSDAANALITVNPNQVAQGRLGILLALPAGQRFSAGVRQIAIVTFAVAATSAASTTITPVDQPILCQASDVNANSLPVSCVSGVLTIFQGLEADVAPRPNGNGAVTIADCVQAGRFIAGLDTPSTGAGGEFQRTDTAPKDTRGDGRLAITDWVQSCRYSAALDPAQSAGGPTSPVATAATATPQSRAPDASADARTLRVISAAADGDGISWLNITLDAQGNENAIGFSLIFDPTAWRFVSATPGGDTAEAMINVNPHQAMFGRLGVALSLPAGRTLTIGARELVRLSFAPVSRVVVNQIAVAFGDYPVAREAADASADTLQLRYAMSGRELRVATIVSGASFNETPLAAESIATAFGIEMASGILAAATFPLPTELAGTRVVVRDGAGIDHLAPLFYVSPTQINYQMPAGATAGPATVIINRRDGGTAVGPTQIATVSPALFTANSTGDGVATALALRLKPDGSQSYEPVAIFDPSQNQFVAAPIELGDENDQVFLILFGTGLRHGKSLSAKIGGADAEVIYFGAQGGFAGFDQINLRIPRSLAGRGDVEVSLTVNGIAANPALIKIE